MSILSGKNILIISSGTDSSTLEIALKKHRATLFLESCTNVTAKYLTKNHIDLAILYHLHEKEPCLDILRLVQAERSLQGISIFALVPDEEAKINEVLMLGAADYITQAESVTSILIKIKNAFGQPDTLSGSNVIDLVEDEAIVTGKGKRVFVVEDDSLLRNLLEAKLEATGLAHSTAKSGETAVEMIRAFKPHVIILDLMLPVKSGFEILAELKSDPQLCKIPVIIFSNRDAEEDKKRVFDLGAERFFVKAMTDLSDLIETIDDLTAWGCLSTGRTRYRGLSTV